MKLEDMEHACMGFGFILVFLLLFIWIAIVNSSGQYWNESDYTEEELIERNKWYRPYNPDNCECYKKKKSSEGVEIL